MSTTLTFLGAAGTVTGSRYLIDTGSARVLVDCGMFQGYKKLRARNWAGPGVVASTVDAVVLTHAHIDHSGYVPRLRNMGFKGPVFCTPGTADLLAVLWPDSGYLHEEDAKRANKYGYTRHQPALPLYTRDDAVHCLAQLERRPYRERFEVAPGVSATFSRAGHILGSACVRLDLGDTSVAFTGDVGRPHDLVMRPAEPLPRADFVVTESTYGDRRHPADDVAAQVEAIINETVAKGGAVLVPAFAVGRAQHLLHLVAELVAARRIPKLPVHLDSPMAIKATEIFFDHQEDHRLTGKQCKFMDELVSYSRTPEDSKAIGRESGPRIIISASGMATGGRVLHHLRQLLPDPRNTVLFVGFQAPGTRGQALVDGGDEIKIHGEYVPVEARVEQIRGLSAHADHRELTDWLRRSELAPKRVFVTHGEPASADAFRRRLKDLFGWDAVVPDHGTRWSLDR